MSSLSIQSAIASDSAIASPAGIARPSISARSWLSATGRRVKLPSCPSTSEFKLKQLPASSTRAITSPAASGMANSRPSSPCGSMVRDGLAATSVLSRAIVTLSAESA